MTFTIYTFGNGDVLFDVFTSIVLMTGAGYESLMRLGMVCLLFGGITYYLARGRVAMQLFMGAILVLFTTVTMKATVQVTDLVNAGVPTRVVGNVPLAVAFPAYMASEVGFQLLTLAETAFATTVPPEYQMMKSTFARGFMDFQKTLGAQLPDSDLQANVTQYLMYCVFPSIGLNQLQKGTIFSSQDVLSTIAVTNPVLTVSQVVSGNPLAPITCPDMYNNVILAGMQNGNPDYDLTMRQLRRSLNVQDLTDQELTPVGQFLNVIVNSTQGARSLINNVLIRERWVDAERLSAASGSDTATSVSLMQKQISEDLKTQAFAQSSIAARFLPMMRTMAESGVYMLTPFILALAMTPAMFATIRMASMSYAWLLFWAPAYAMVNYLVYAYGNGLVQSLVSAGTGVTLASYTDFYDFLAQMNSFASTIIWGVPSIAAVAMYGMGSAASALMGGTQGAQHAASSEATSFAHGRGEHVDPGHHLTWQDAASTDGHQVSHQYYAGGEGGLMMESQTGAQTVHFSDGAQVTSGRDGMTSYSGPRGSYSQDHNGNYVAGVWRQDIEGPDGQHHKAQFQVSGDHVDVQYMTEDGHGIQHDIKMEMNQMANEPKSVSDTYSSDGFTKQLTTMGDGSQQLRQVGTSMVTARRNGQTVTGPMDVVGNFYRASENDPWEGVVTAHSTKDGEFQYSLSNIQSDDLGAPDLTKSMWVTSGSGSDQFTQHGNWKGLSLTEMDGPDGESRMQVFGGGQNLGLVAKDGSVIPLKGVTITGEGTKGSDGTPQDVNATVTGMDEHGMEVTAKGKLGFDPKTGEKLLDVSTAHWESKLDGQSSGTVMRVGQQDGQGGYELNGGGVQYDSNPNHTDTPWHYRGQIQDLTSGDTFNGEIHFDGNLLYASNMSTGEEKIKVGENGDRELISGSVDSEKGARVQRTESGMFLWPTGTTNAEGAEVMSFRKMDVTSTLQRSRDPLNPEQTTDSVIDTVASGTDSRGSFSVKSVVSTVQAGDKLAIESGTSMSVGDGTYSSGLDGQSADDRLVGMKVVRPISGTQGADLRSTSIKQGAHGPEVHEDQRQPFTNKKAVGRVRGLDEETKELAGGVAHLYRSNDPNHFGQILSGDIDGKLEVTRPETLSLKGIDGPVKAMVRRELDPHTGETVHASLENGIDGHVWGAKKLPGNRVEEGIISFKGKDEHGEPIFDFKATSTAEIEEGSKEKFASQLVIDKANSKVLRDDAVGGTKASWRHAREDDIRFSLESNIIGTDAYESHSNPLELSDNQRTGMAIGSAAEGVAHAVQGFGSVTRPLGRRGPRKSQGASSPSTSRGSSRKSPDETRSGLNDNRPSTPSPDQQMHDKLAREALEFKKRKEEGMLGHE